MTDHVAIPAPKTSLPETTSRWDAAAGKREACVSLASLPANITFDDSCPEPIRYDAAQKKLRYRGQMYHTNYMYLRSLSTDAAYGHAMDELFAASVPRDEAGAKFPWMWVAVGAFLLTTIGAVAVWAMR
jgi:hypothetical protein